MRAEERFLLHLVAVAFGADVSGVCKEEALKTDWERVMSLAMRQGVGAVALDAIERIPAELRPERKILLPWIGCAMRLEQAYEGHQKRLGDFVEFYARNGIKVLLLKGYGCSLQWERPEHRPTGDVDIYLFGRQDEADALVEKELGIGVHREYHKHSTFDYRGVEVENHSKFIDDVSHRSNIRFERILMEQLSKDECLKCPIDNVLLPSPTFNALFLLRHTGEHFASNEILLRHVLDVGTLFRKYHNVMDWSTVFDVYMETRMQDFFDGIATICVEFFGMDRKCFASADGRYSYRHDKELALRILADIFTEKEHLPMSTVGIDTVGKKLRYAISKSLRWWRNRWKYRLVYDENLFQSFWWLARNRMR